MRKEFLHIERLTLCVQEVADGNSMRSIVVDCRISEHLFPVLLGPNAHVLLPESLSMPSNVVTLLIAIN